MNAAAGIPFSGGQLDRLFPFHFSVGPDERLHRVGRSLQRIAPDCEGKRLTDVFEISRPSGLELNFSALLAAQGELVILQWKGANRLIFRGEFGKIEDRDEILFFGSPWFDNMDAVREYRLGIADFAVSDPLIDLLHLLKTQELATQDIKVLLDTVNRQRNELRAERQAFERLSRVASANTQGVVFTDQEGRITWCNEGFERMTGHPSAQALGQTPILLLKGPLTDRDIMRTMAAKTAQKEAFELELQTYRADGTWFWANVKVQPLYQANGSFSAFFAVVEDVHERKLAAERLLRSESRLSTVVRNTNEGVILESEDRRIVLINQRFCDLFGIPAPPDALIGADCSQSAEQTKHLFRDPEAFLARITEVLQAREKVIGDILELCDGRIFERTYLPIFEGEAYRGHLWRYDDVTERLAAEQNLRRQEEKYRNIIANMNLGLIEVDLEGRVLFANQSFLDMSGYTLPELVGREPSHLLLPQEAWGIMEEKNSLRGNGIADMYELPIRNKQGQMRWWIISGAPSHDDEGNQVGSIGIHLDITTQKQLEQELNVAKAKAEQSSRAKEAFLANMSHEIRTPLNAIIGVFRELKRARLEPAQAGYLDSAQTAAHHLLSIINNILDMSKIEAGELKLELESFSIRSAIENAVAIMQVQAERKSLLLHADIDTEVAGAYLGDDMRVRQVLLNLLGNAIKFTDEGSVSIRCRIHSTSPSGHILAITVKDTGVGMDPSFIESIFQKFSQEDPSTARRYGGTGLGMAISQQLVEMMGGNIYAESQLGKGTVFEVMLPLLFGSEQAVPETSSAALEDGFAGLRGKRILLAEDNPLNQMVAIASLEHFGMQVVKAENGLLAIQRMQEQEFDLVLMDVQMPEMDGVAATMEIRKFDPHTPIVALSANAFKREVDLCLSAGMNEYVTKPFDEQVLMQVIDRLVNGQGGGKKASPKGEEQQGQRPYDLKRIRDISRGNEAFVQQMVDLFLVETPESLAAIAKALAAGDPLEVKRLAHRMKPSLEAMGMPLAHAAVRELERLGGERAEHDLLESQFQELSRHLEVSMAAIRTDYSR